MERRIAISTESLLGIAVFGLFCLLAVTDLKAFEPWPQITLLWDSGWPLMHFIDHFHFERYLVGYIGLMMEEAYPNIGFSIYTSFFVALNTLLFRHIHKAFTGHAPSLAGYAIFLLIHLFMNGRGPFGWSGWLFCLFLHSRFMEPDRSGPFLTVSSSFLLLLSILFSSVSSGVFMVVFAANAMLVARITMTYERGQKLNLMRIFSNVFASIVVGYVIYRAILYMLDAILKVHLYYGSYTKIIAHGLGLLAQKYDLVIVLLILAIMVIGFSLLVGSIKGHLPPVLWPLFIISMVGGAFGFTTLTLNIILFLVFLDVLIRRLLKRGRVPTTNMRSI